jgi:LmbE family N-acetylglucosaminyl deacetylase
MKKILVISPHPDDEVIGCGGTLAKYISEGNRIEIIFLTSGEDGIKGKNDVETMQIREQESKNVAKFMGFNHIEFYREKDGELNVTQELIQVLRKLIKDYNPDEIFVTHDMEQHPDHKQAAKLVLETLPKMNSEFKLPVVWMYEVWTPLQQMDRIEDISEYVDIKRKAIQTYKSQCAVMNFEEAILGLNRYRGEMHSWPGGNYAEVFKKLGKFSL